MNNYSDIIYIIRCAINGQKAEQSKTSSIDFDELFNFCELQKITSLVYSAIKDLDIKNAEKWEEAHGKNVKTLMLYENERSRIFNFLNDNQIWYAPLKGIVMQAYYPSFGLREMTDNDILFDETKTSILNEYMLSNNFYLAEDNTDDRHICYQKLPCYNFEFHKTLFTEDDKKDKILNFFEDINNRLEGNAYSKSLSDLDTYLYLIAHLYKHYSITGCGLRPLIDIYLFLQKTNICDEDINKSLEKMGLANFESWIKKLTLKLFSEDFEFTNLNEEEQKLIDCIMKSLPYGTNDFMLDKRLNEIKGSNKSLIRHLFPSYSHMKNNGLSNIKYPFLLPIYWIRYNNLRLKSYGLKTAINGFKNHFFNKK